MTDRSKGQLDWVTCAYTLPMLCREIIEGHPFPLFPEFVEVGILNLLGVVVCLLLKNWISREAILRSSSIFSF